MKKNKMLIIARLALVAIVSSLIFACGDGEVTNKTHVGNFKNKEGVNATDLHVVFDVEGVEVVEKKGGFPNSETDKDNKKQINFSGGTVPGGPTEGVANLKFKTAKGDFKVVEWWWTTVDPETKEHKKLGETKTGPPVNDNGTSAWE